MLLDEPYAHRPKQYLHLILLQQRKTMLFGGCLFHPLVLPLLRAQSLCVEARDLTFSLMQQRILPVCRSKRQSAALQRL